MSINCSGEERDKFLIYVSQNPLAFSTAKAGTFLDKRQMIADRGKAMGIGTSVLFNLVSSAKLKGLLGAQGELAANYHLFLKRYLK